MSISETLLPEFEQEMATTRRVLERVPSDKGEWKPHPKSFSLGHLAQLVSWMPGWITNALQETSLDLSQAGKYSYETTETLLRKSSPRLSWIELCPQFLVAPHKPGARAVQSV